MVYHDLLVFKGVFAPDDFEDDEARTGAGNLAYSAHEEISVQVLSPATCSESQSTTLVESFFVGVVIAAHDLRRLALVMGLEIEGFETAIVDILDLSEGMLDEL